MKEEKCEGQSDTSLTTTGKMQAHKIANYLASIHLSGLYTSNLHRTNQCARIIAATVPQKIKRDERLADMHLGIWQGKFPEEIESRYPEIWQVRKKDPAQAVIPDGEQWSSVVHRVHSFLDEIRDDELFDKNLIVITHDIIVRIILLYCEGKPTTSFWEYQLDKGSLTKVQIEPEKKVIEINYTDHLYVPHFV